MAKKELFSDIDELVSSLNKELGKASAVTTLLACSYNRRGERF